MSNSLRFVGRVRLRVPTVRRLSVKSSQLRVSAGAVTRKIKPKANGDAKIKLGLERTRELLKGVDLSWRAVHVAGTNGKGTTCLYVDAMLRAAGIRTGRFLSPHLFDRWDGISINDQAVSQDLFLGVEDKVKWRNDKGQIQASPYEILTATAFQIFNSENVQIGVVECGIGGLMDATNVIEDPLISIITSIGMDHMDFLGDLKGIATHKAGIIKPGRPCVISPENLKIAHVDPRRARVVQDVLIARGRTLKSDITWTNYISGKDTDTGAQNALRKAGLSDFLSEPAKARGMLLAATAFREAVRDLKKMGLGPPDLDSDSPWTATRSFVEAMIPVALPGRLQEISIECLTGRKAPILLDGAHNRAAWSFLAAEVNTRLRSSHRATSEHHSVTWVVGMGERDDKKPDQMMRSLFRVKPGQDKGDAIIAVEFGPVDGMPWVNPRRSESFKDAGAESFGKDLLGALKRATELAKEGPLVVTGSLYLVADVLRLLRDKGVDPDVIWRRQSTEPFT